MPSPDAAEIRADPERSEQFAKLVFTLKEYAGGSVPLPDAQALLELFGKVWILCYFYINV